MNIFNADMNEFEAKVYIKCITDIAKSDGFFHANEKSFINTQSTLYGVDLNSIDEFDCKNINFATISKLTKMSILRDCIVVANIDNNYDDSERDKIVELASGMEISENEFMQLEDWLFRYWELLKEGNELIGNSSS